jgi:hypothetical protein
MLMLESHNYNEFLERIPWDELTRTFRHAIIAARKLGYSYIWIDSLCIIQRDHRDWSIESTKMAAVYKSSALNLAAAGGANGNAGLFLDRNPVSLWKPRFHLPKSAITICFSYEFCQPVIGSKLWTRAWVVQERWLSPRTLHFTKDMLYWECGQGEASDIVPEIEMRNWDRMKYLGDDDAQQDFDLT